MTQNIVIQEETIWRPVKSMLKKFLRKRLGMASKICHSGGNYLAACKKFAKKNIDIAAVVGVITNNKKLATLETWWLLVITPTTAKQGLMITPPPGGQAKNRGG